MKCHDARLYVTYGRRWSISINGIMHILYFIGNRSASVIAGFLAYRLNADDYFWRSRETSAFLRDVSTVINTVRILNLSRPPPPHAPLGHLPKLPERRRVRGFITKHAF